MYLHYSISLHALGLRVNVSVRVSLNLCMCFYVSPILSVYV